VQKDSKKDSKTKAKAAPKPMHFVWLEQLIIHNLQALFPGMEVLEAHPFHVTRDAETAIQQLEAGDLLESVEEGVWQRRFADVVRMEVNRQHAGRDSGDSAEKSGTGARATFTRSTDRWRWCG
jgi:polyphosphate kinase